MLSIIYLIIKRKLLNINPVILKNTYWFLTKTATFHSLKQIGWTWLTLMQRKISEIQAYSYFKMNINGLKQGKTPYIKELLELIYKICSDYPMLGVK